MTSVEEFVVKINHNISELKEKFETATKAAEQLENALDDIDNMKLEVSSGNEVTEDDKRFTLKDLDAVSEIVSQRLKKHPDIPDLKKRHLWEVMKSIEEYRESDGYEVAYNKFETPVITDYHEVETLVNGLVKRYDPVFSPEKDMIFFYGRDVSRMETYKVWIKVPELEIHAVHTRDGKLVYQ